MARTSKGGIGRKSMRQRKHQLWTKTLNRKRNLHGCEGKRHV